VYELYLPYRLLPMHACTNSYVDLLKAGFPMKTGFRVDQCSIHPLADARLENYAPPFCDWTWGPRVDFAPWKQRCIKLHALKPWDSEIYGI